MPRGWKTHRRTAAMLSLVVLPFSFSSRLILITAADKPIATANMGSATREMMYAGAGIAFRVAGWRV